MRADDVVLLTGASRGIGRAAAERLVPEAGQVIATSRRAADLAALAAAHDVDTLGLDLCDAEAVHAALADRHIDVLVHCAGIIGPSAKLHEAPAAPAAEVFSTNVLALQHCLAAVLPGMLARNHGHVLCIGSVAGTYPVGMPLYAASKAALHAMLANLRLDVHGSDIRVSEIQPGRVSTGMHAQLFDGDAAAADAALYAPYETLSAEDVAEAIAWVLGAPPHVDVTLMELMPTHYAVGGARYHRRG